jgi:hypothetical protein
MPAAAAPLAERRPSPSISMLIAELAGSTSGMGYLIIASPEFRQQ